MQDAARKGGVAASGFSRAELHDYSSLGHCLLMGAVFLGPRSSLLLGLLQGPMTVAELYQRAERASRLDRELAAEIGALATKLTKLPLGSGSPLMILGQISDAGEEGVLRELERLKEHGLVDSTPADNCADGELAALWFRRPLG